MINADIHSRLRACAGKFTTHDIALGLFAQADLQDVLFFFYVFLSRPLQRFVDDPISELYAT